MHRNHTFRLFYIRFIKTLGLPLCLLFYCLLLPFYLSARLYQPALELGKKDTIRIIEPYSGYRHQLNVELKMEKVFRPTSFYAGDDKKQLSVKRSNSGHLKYLFALPEGTLGSRVFPNTYQGIGLSYIQFDNREHVGAPFAAYLLQRSEILKANSHLSVDYEWNFGLSAGWVPYHPEHNTDNTVIGSRVNAYLNVGLYLRWQLARRISMTGGIDLTHFSNGNTEYPNAGLNSSGLKVGAIYDFSREKVVSQTDAPIPIPRFLPHFSYDVILFGSWRRKGIDFYGHQIASPNKYPVFGFVFAPMYNWNYRFCTGFSVDGIYDGSANVYSKDYITGTEQEFFKPGLHRQIAMGLSAKVDYRMPVFTLSMGIGTNVLHKGGDFGGTYQTLALKISATKRSFLHIGYTIKDFHDPNYLMLGLGFRFSNKTPSLLCL